MNNNQKLAKFETFHKNFLGLLSLFLKEKRKAILFDKWSLQDVVVHLTSWNNVNILHTEQIRDNKTIKWIEDVDAFNAKEVAKRKNDAWEDIYSDFLVSGEGLIKLFTSLPDSAWNKPSDKEHLTTTPQRFLLCVIDHYKNEHIPQIEKVLRERGDNRTTEEADAFIDESLSKEQNASMILLYEGIDRADCAYVEMQLIKVIETFLVNNLPDVE